MACAAAASLLWMVPDTVPGGKPTIEEPGLPPRSPVTEVRLVLLTAVWARTPKGAALLRFIGDALALLGFAPPLFGFALALLGIAVATTPITRTVAMAPPSRKRPAFRRTARRETAPAAGVTSRGRSARWVSALS